jgi:hypothetical protein
MGRGRVEAVEAPRRIDRGGPSPFGKRRGQPSVLVDITQGEVRDLEIGGVVRQTARHVGSAGPTQRVPVIGLDRGDDTGQRGCCQVLARAG